MRMPRYDVRRRRGGDQWSRVETFETLRDAIIQLHMCESMNDDVYIFDLLRNDHVAQEEIGKCMYEEDE